jgi:hypothetical protein
LHFEGIESRRFSNEPRRVGQEVPDGDAVPRRRCVVEILSNGIVEPEPAILDEQHDPGGDEVLA